MALRELTSLTGTPRRHCDSGINCLPRLLSLIHNYNMSSIAQKSNTELNSTTPAPNDSEVGPNNSASRSNLNTTETDSDKKASSGVDAGNNVDYPEQRHAGAVGYGPAYKQDVVSSNFVIATSSQSLRIC